MSGKSLENLTIIGVELEQLSNAFYDTGNLVLSERLLDMSVLLLNTRDDINRDQQDSIRAQFAQSEQSYMNTINTAIVMAKK